MKLDKHFSSLDFVNCSKTYDANANDVLSTMPNQRLLNWHHCQQLISAALYLLSHRLFWAYFDISRQKNKETLVLNKDIDWKFNPPAAPHMGGAWERLIRSVKIVLYKICPSQRFTDESLRSALMEVEMTVNSRPLTFVSLEHVDHEAITPNHFLLGSSNRAKPFAILGKSNRA